MQFHFQIPTGILTLLLIFLLLLAIAQKMGRLESCCVQVGFF